jgi:hypothetical protein
MRWLSQADGRFSWARVRAVVGAALLAFVIVHLVLCWPLVGEPRAFVAESADRLQSGLARALAVAALVLFAAHLLLVFLDLRARLPSRGLDRVEGLASALASAFVLYHVSHVRVLESGPHLGAFAPYGALLADLGQPLPLLAYVVGVTAVCFLAAFNAMRCVSREPAGTTVSRFAFGTLGLLLWAFWLQPLAKLATGATLF